MSAARAARAAWPQSAALFAALGDETRLRLLVRLSINGPGSIAKLSSTADVSRQAIRKHLDVLAEAGLVRGEPRGREHIWRLRPERLAEAGVLLEGISGQWDEALDRLKRFVEL
jgi:DNA-binding transcriptional ArsR family regulator